MRNAASFVGVDLGASSGRVIAGHWNGSRVRLEEIHRFPNGGISMGGRLHWDMLHLWSQVKQGMSRFSSLYGSPASVAVDAWGVDFGLLDEQGRLIGNPLHYRDGRTKGIAKRLSRGLDGAALFAETGVQPWHINTLYQLYSMVLADDPQLRIAAKLLTIPDLFTYFLSGVSCVEFTQATTTQMYAPKRRDWFREAVRWAGIPERILGDVVPPCTVLGQLKSAALPECSLHGDIPVIAVASHDTASAVAAVPQMDSDSVFISSGTWSLMGIEVAEPNCSEEAREQGFTNEGSVHGKFLLLKNLPGLWIMQECLRSWRNGGKSLNWEEVIEAASQAPPFRTFLDTGDMSFEACTDMPRAVQQYCHRSGQPVPASVGEFARALFESLALSYRATLASFERVAGKRLHTVRIVGGGSRNYLLSQMAANACQRKVVAGPAEATVLGNVVAQAVATGHLANLEQGRRAISDSCDCREYEPQPDEGWEQAFARFQNLCRTSSAEHPVEELT